MKNKGMEEWTRLRQDFEREAGRYHDLGAETYFVTKQGTMGREKAFTKPNHAILLYQYFGNATEENHPDLGNPELSVFAVVSGSQTELFRKMAARAGSLLPGELRVTLLQAVVERFLDKDKPGKPVHSLNHDPLAAWLMFILTMTATIHPNRMDGTALRVDPFSASLTAIDFILDSKERASQNEKISEQSQTAVSAYKPLNNNTPSAPDKKWHEKPFGIILLTVLSGVIVVYVAYYLGWNGPKETKQQTQEQKPLATPSSNIFQKTPSHSLPSKKSEKTIPQPSINANNSNVVIGPANNIIQTINNLPEPKPLPLKDRLISCLDEIDKKIIPALRAGTTIFEGKVLPYQLAELQKLSAESGASEYIALTVKPGIIFRKSGNAYSVKFKLSSALLQQEKSGGVAP